PNGQYLTARGYSVTVLSLMNTYVIGQQGKTTLLIQQFLDAIAHGGALFVDPDGAATPTILSLIPKEKTVLLIDPTEHPVSFIVFYDVRNKPLMISLLLQTVKAIWKYDTIATPVLDRVLYNTLAALFEYPNATLLDIEPLLTNKTFRKRVLEHVSDPVLIAKWAYWETFPDKEWRQLISSTENKAGEFSEDPRIRQ